MLIKTHRNKLLVENNCQTKQNNSSVREESGFCGVFSEPVWTWDSVTQREQTDGYFSTQLSQYPFS